MARVELRFMVTAAFERDVLQFESVARAILFLKQKMSQTKGMTHVSDSIHLKVIRPLSMVVG